MSVSVKRTFRWVERAYDRRLRKQKTARRNEKTMSPQSEIPGGSFFLSSHRGVFLEIARWGVNLLAGLETIMVRPRRDVGEPVVGFEAGTERLNVLCLGDGPVRWLSSFV